MDNIIHDMFLDKFVSFFKKIGLNYYFCISSANMANFCKKFVNILIPRNWKNRKEKKRKAWPSCALILMPYQK
jgi:hypothetical protein